MWWPNTFPKGTETEDEPEKPEKQVWIYESPDNGVTVFRIPFGDYDTPREKIREAGEWLLPEGER